MARKTKKMRLKKQLSDYELKHRYVDKYKHLKSIGFSEDQTTKMIRRDASMASINKLQDRVMFARGQVGTTGVSLKGIRLTSSVMDYIKELEKGDIIKPYRKGNDVLMLAHPKEWRPGL